MVRQDSEQDDRIADSAARRLLRDVTVAAHERLHVHPILQPLLSPALTLAQYRTALEGLFGFHAAMERVMDLAPSRADLIRRDLAVLGTAEDRLAGLRHAPTVAPPADDPSRLGYRYVILGSYMGGKLIAANLGRTLGVGPDSGAAFFSGVGADVGGLWRTLIADLEAGLNTDDHRRAAAAGALAAFGALGDWLDQRLAAAGGPGS